MAPDQEPVLDAVVSIQTANIWSDISKYSKCWRMVDTRSLPLKLSASSTPSKTSWSSLNSEEVTLTAILSLLTEMFISSSNCITCLPSKC